ncbi:unnamed protein product [Paramecium pentaurelia]|uniref:ATP synthase subunit gamma, mitochondrial n=1 Tax=Paramecium pentaurelia TaxID=43138 RepID=A0A8S1VSB7_9CILI|nr:unnamed protein product [Paramecium pentaurelia]
MQRLQGATLGLWNSLTPVPQYAFATLNLKQLKQRMKSVGSIRKITKAMKMVAASKMKQDVQRLENGKHFGIRSIQDLFANETYLQKKQLTFKINKTLLVPITSDKGLCGGINSSIIRETRTVVRQNRNAYKLFLIGEKSLGALQRAFPELLTQAITAIQTPINFINSSSIAHQIQLNVTDDVDQISIIFNQFKNVVQQIVKRVDLLNRKNFIAQFRLVTKYDTAEPEKEFVQNYMYEYYVATAFYHAMLNSLASETSSRMNAMENASKNAGEMLDKLTLEYNKVRQAKITVELCEIISGASAV